MISNCKPKGEQLCSSTGMALNLERNAVRNHKRNGARLQNGIAFVFNRIPHHPAEGT
jgi:hypothetical protein